MPSIDFNCDLGESFGAWRMGNDQAVLPYVSSINVACGFHAGDPQTIKQTVEQASALKIAIGAHPGLPDLRGFGRRAIAVSANDLYADTLYQIGALAGFARVAGTRLTHVKPHGALYHMLDQQLELADAFVRAVRDFDASLLLFGSSTGRFLQTAQTLGMGCIHEVFADRSYEENGQLTPRALAGATLDQADACRQLDLILREGIVITRQGSPLALRAQTVCLHGDRSDAAAMAQALRATIAAAGFAICVQGRGPA